MRYLPILVVTIFSACISQAPINIEEEEISEWKLFEHPQLDYSFEYPAEYELKLYQQDVQLRWDSYPLVVINYVSPREGEKRGLWAGHQPYGYDVLDGVSCALYRYQHFDGPFGMKVLSYVVPFREKELGLEFRVDSLDDVLRHIKESFQFE